MKVLILYRPVSEHARAVEEFVHEFQRLYPQKTLEVKDFDAQENTAVLELYDITDQPTILALKDDGQLAQSWQGVPLPLMNEIAYYADA